MGDKEWTVSETISSFPTGAPIENSTSPIPFFHLLERLKTTKRSGWKRFGILHGESLSDHQHRMTILCLLAPPSLHSQLDMLKCMKLATIHDLAESIVGDLTPADNVPKAEKYRRERASMDYICTKLLGNVHGNETRIGEEVLNCWEEFESGTGLEARFVRDLDKIELLLQMVEYEKSMHSEGKEVDLEEFTYVVTKIEMSEMKGWAGEIIKEREEFWKGKTKKTKVESEEEIMLRNSLQDQYYGK